MKIDNKEGLKMKQVVEVPYVNTPLTKEVAADLISADLDYKEAMSVNKIEEWFTAWGGQCHVNFSGGKDSTVLCFITAKWLSLFKNPPYPLNIVFVNTGLEFPEIQLFVNDYVKWLQNRFPRLTINLRRIRPQMNVRQVLTRYGYPIVSKRIAEIIYYGRKSPDSERGRLLRGEGLDKNGNKSKFNCQQWSFLKDAPFMVSSECCHIMKRHPIAQVNKTSAPMIATMASESMSRHMTWLKQGCNAFEGREAVGKPMSFWTDQDVLTYIVKNEIPIAPVYGDIIEDDCGFQCSGCQRTGCVFCGFGVHREKGENRFQLLHQTHPKHWDFCVNGGEFDTDGLWKPNEKGLGWGRVLDYIGVPSV